MYVHYVGLTIYIKVIKSYQVITEAQTILYNFNKSPTDEIFMKALKVYSKMFTLKLVL